MPTQSDYVFGRLAVDLGYLTHEQIGKAFLDHQRQVEQQGMKISLAEMLVVQGLLTGDRARELEEAAAVEDGAKRPGTPGTPGYAAAAGKSAGTQKRRTRRPSTRSYPPVKPPEKKNPMWIAAGGTAVILLLAVVALLIFGGGSSDAPSPPAPVATETPVTEAPVAGTPVAEAPDEDPVDETAHAEADAEQSEDDLFASLRRESEERRGPAVVAEGTAAADAADAADDEPDISELLASVEGGRAAARPATDIRRGLVGHWAFDEDAGDLAIDLSGRAAPARIVGARRVKGVIGGALEFDGEDDQVALPRPVEDDFTISFWLRTDRRGTSGLGQQWWEGSGLVDGETDGDARDFGVSLLGRNIAMGIGEPDTTLVSRAAVADGAWHHVAATRVRATGETRIFVDGALDASGSANTETLAAATRLVLGSIQTGHNHFLGALDDIRIYDRALGADAIGTLADTKLLAAAELADLTGGGAPASLAPPATGIGRGLVGHWTFDEGAGTLARDASGLGAEATVRGAKWTKGRIGGALEFGGTDDYVRTPGFASPTWAATVACWARSDTPTWNHSGMLLAKRDSFILHPMVGCKELRFHVNCGGWPFATADLTIDLTRWHHYLGTYDATTGSIRLYVDGELAATATTAGAMKASAGPLLIGWDDWNEGRFFDGAIDDVRVYERALSPDEIRTLADPELLAAAETAAGREPQTPPATGIGRGLVGHWTFDEGKGTLAGDSSGRGAEATVRGAKWTEGRIGGALEFNGIDDYVETGRPASRLGVGGARPRSVCFWMQSRSRDPGGVYDLGSAREGEDFSVRCERDDSFWRVNLWGDDNDFTFRVATLNMWAHIAVVYDGGEVTVYGNGILLAAKRVPLNTTDDKTFAIGRWVYRDAGGRQRSYFCGLIDDVRIYARALEPVEIKTLANPVLLAATLEAEREAAEGAAKTVAEPEPPDAFAPVFAEFDDLVGKGDYAGARKLMADAAKDPDLADHAEAARAAAKVCESLILRKEAAVAAVQGLAGNEIKLDTRKGPAKGKVRGATDKGIVILERIFINRVAMGETRRLVPWPDLAPARMDEFVAAGGWKPEGPDDHVALAVLALHRRDAAGVARAFIAAGDHPLIECYRKRLERD